MHIKKEIPFVLTNKNRNLDARIVNYSENGLGIRIFKKVALPVGGTVSIRIENAQGIGEVQLIC